MIAMSTSDSSNLIALVSLAVIMSFFFVVWLFALISALRNERLDSTMKLVWVLVILLVNGLGAILYLLVAPNRTSRGERTLAAWQARNRHRRQMAASLERDRRRHQLRPASHTGENNV